jgi:hypothetical protein
VRNVADGREIRVHPDATERTTGATSLAPGEWWITSHLLRRMGRRQRGEALYHAALLVGRYQERRLPAAARRAIKRSDRIPHLSCRDNVPAEEDHPAHLSTPHPPEKPARRSVTCHAGDDPLADRGDRWPRIDARTALTGGCQRDGGRQRRG